MIKSGGKLNGVTKACSASLAVCLMASAAADDGAGRVDEGIRFGGYLRGYLGWNADNPQEVAGKDNRGRLSMQREEVYLEADGKHSAFQWKLAGRAVREQATSYLKDLQDLTRQRSGYGRDHGFDIESLYSNEEIREGWIQFQPHERLNVKVGKQQVVWGETDIFQALDVIHGQNFTWGPMLQEPDETRKPLFLLNTTFSVPEANGSFQLVVRPGLDDEKDLGSTWDVYGGRSRVSAYKGYSTWYGAKADWHHPEGDKNDVTYALRWKGTAAGLGYHLSYVKSFYTRNPIVNSVFAPYKQNPVDNGNGGTYNLITPIVDVYGAGINGYSQALDTVLTGEVIYTNGEPFNQGSVGSGALALSCLGGTGAMNDASAFSGFCGIKRKNTVMTMLRGEKQFNTMGLGSSGPTSVSVQLFNTTILDFKDGEELVQAAGFPDLAHKNTSIGTLVVRTPWLGDKLASTIALGREFTNHGSFAAIAADYELGTNWRLRAEYDGFWGKNSTSNGGLLGANMPVGSAAGTSGLLDKNDRFYLRATYQF